jgi:hypothetical protein
MKPLLKPLSMLAMAAAAVVSFAQTVQKGTDVDLKFMQTLTSKTAVVGQRVQLAVAHDVMADGMTILKAGTPVSGVITKVDHRDHFGKNARLRIAINPVRTHGGTLYLEPRDKQSITGRRTDKAAGVSAGGAAVLGPVGLLGGYFVVGKQVKVQVGDPLATEVSRTVSLHA